MYYIWSSIPVIWLLEIWTLVRVLTLLSVVVLLILESLLYNTSDINVLVVYWDQFLLNK